MTLGSELSSSPEGECFGGRGLLGTRDTCTAREGALLALRAADHALSRRTFELTELVEGTVSLAILAGRESVRGTLGGNQALTLEAGGIILTVPASSLAQDTAVSIDKPTELSPFLATGTSFEPVSEAILDFAGASLTTSAGLSIEGTVEAGEAWVVVRVDRVLGIPRLLVVALAEASGGRIAAVAVPGLPGIREDGRYVFYRVTEQFGWVSGPTTLASTGQGVSAVVESDRLPFIARSFQVTADMLRGARTASKWMSAAGKLRFAKTLAAKIRDRHGRLTTTVTAALRRVPATGRNMERLLIQLASASDQTLKGAWGTLKVLRDAFHESSAVRQKLAANLGLPNGTATLEAVEESIQITGWLTKTFKQRMRFPDITLTIGGLRYRFDIKNWLSFPPSQRQLDQALDAMRRDLVIHLKEGSLDRLRWVFPETLKAKRTQITQDLKKATYGKEFRQRLRNTDRTAYPVGPIGDAALNAAVQRARQALETARSFGSMT